MINKCDFKATGNFFTGNDPVGLYYNSTLVDIIGVMNEVVTDWDLFTAGDTKDDVIIRNTNIYGPTSTWDNTQWTRQGNENWDNVGEHTVVAEEPAA